MDALEMHAMPDSGVMENRSQFMAFVKDSQSEELIKGLVQQLLIPQASIQRGDISVAISQLEETRSPQLLIVDLSESNMPLQDINALADVCEPGVKVIAIGEQNDVGLFRDLVRAGVSDYLVKPLNSSLLQTAVVSSEEALDTRIGSKNARMSVFMGVRGGVGTSTLAANIAYHFSSDFKRRTSLLDLDLQTGVSSLLLDSDPVSGLLEALDDPRRTDSLVVERLASKVDEKLLVFGSETPLERPISSGFRGMEVFLQEVRQQCHFVVADLPRHLLSPAVQMVRSASTIVLVTDLTLAGLRDTARYVQALGALQCPGEVLVVANKAPDSRNTRFKESEIREQLGRDIDFTVSLDSKAFQDAELKGEPLVSGSHAASRQIKAIAERVSGRGAPRRNRGSILKRLIGR
ncbi:MAG: AAA family ATPase [Pseudomonadota bacterium]